MSAGIQSNHSSFVFACLYCVHKNHAFTKETIPPLLLPILYAVLCLGHTLRSSRSAYLNRPSPSRREAMRPDCTALVPNGQSTPTVQEVLKHMVCDAGLRLRWRGSGRRKRLHNGLKRRDCRRKRRRRRREQSDDSDKRHRRGAHLHGKQGLVKRSLKDVSTPEAALLSSLRCSMLGSSALNEFGFTVQSHDQG